MTEINKIREQFHYYNIQSGIDSVYGNWAVSCRGDVVNCLYPYVIFSMHLNDDNWLVKLKQKCWFMPECETHLRKALKRAKEITKKSTRIESSSYIK